MKPGDSFIVESELKDQHVACRTAVSRWNTRHNWNLKTYTRPDGSLQVYRAADVVGIPSKAPVERFKPKKSLGRAEFLDYCSAMRPNTVVLLDSRHKDVFALVEKWLKDAEAGHRRVYTSVRTKNRTGDEVMIVACGLNHSQLVNNAVSSSDFSANLTVSDNKNYVK